MKILEAEFNVVNKVGFALDIGNIPDYYKLKKNVLNWERQFWQISYNSTLPSYKAFIDTTFALYKPGYPARFDNKYFYEGIRLAGEFTATHGGWYLNLLNMTDEEKNYQETSSSSSSWLIRKDGSLNPKYYAK